jgi:isopenicillin N synthase-like dioxygenase
LIVRLLIKYNYMFNIDVHEFRSSGKQAKRNIADRVRASCVHIGFLTLSNHGVPQECIDRVLSNIKYFFSLPLIEKQSPQVSQWDYRGYIPIGRFKSDDPERPEIAEAFKLYRGPEQSYCRPGPPMAPNLWPVKPSSFREAILAYWRKLDELRDTLLRMFALALDLSEEHFLASFSRSMTNMTLLHYPSTTDCPMACGVRPHTDTDALTVLFPDPIGGLMIETPDRACVEAIAKPGELLVNIGDMMEIWSGGRFVSTRHWVVNHSGKERYAFPYFAAPNPEVIVHPLRPPLDGFNRLDVEVAKVPEYTRALACPH